MTSKVLLYLVATNCLFGLFTSCNSDLGQEASIKIKAIKLLYSKPYVISSKDSVTEYKSDIYVAFKGLIINQSLEKEDFTLNNLRERNYSFDLIATMENKSIPFYNYSFSRATLPVRNTFKVNPKDSVFITLESPLLFSSEHFRLTILDSILRELKNIKFDIKTQRETISNKYKIDTIGMALDIVPVEYK